MIETVRIALRVFIPKGRRGRWVALVGLSLAVAGAETLTAYLIFRVLDYASDPPPDGGSVDLALGIEVAIVPLLVLAGVTFVARGGLALFNAWAESRVVQGAAASVSALIHRRYLEAPYVFHLSRTSSESVRTVLWSVDSATVNALTPMVTILSQGLVAVTLFALLVGIAPVLSLGALVLLGGGLALILLVVKPILTRIGELSETTIKHLLLSVRDSFDSVRDIKAYRAESFFDRRFRTHRRTIAQIRTTKAVVDQVPRTVLEFLVVLGLLLVVGLAVAGDSFGTFIPVLGAFGYATLRVTPSLTRVVAAANRLTFGQEAMRNVEHDLRSAIPPAEAPEPGRAIPPGGLFDHEIAFRGVRFTYPGADRPALADVDLAIGRGEMLAIAGGSGSGKSTLIDLLLGLLEPDAGRILVDGADRSLDGWHSAVGIVSQHVVLLDGTIRDNVAFGAGSAADDARVLAALDAAQLGDWVAASARGLDSEVGESGKSLSGGERQRIAIARALYRQPDLLILDEATSALDGATEAALVDRLAEMSDTLTTVVVSHRIAPIRAADRAVVLEAGRVVASGTYDELLDVGDAFRDLVGLADEVAP